jgi:septal ring factor EnvC (AmiA/AmiB activator)
MSSRPNWKRQAARKYQDERLRRIRRKHRKLGTRFSFLEWWTMSEQVGVQVREGVWLTRDGEHVEVRARDMTGNESSEWQWLGRRKNLLATWRNDGTLNASREQSNGDLVQFLRPLPATETTTEQLAEIEAGMAEIEKDVAELVQQDEASRLRAELVQVTTARDYLEQQLAFTTSERDILAQRLATNPSEEALQKEVSRKQIEINTLKDQLEFTRGQRDAARFEITAMTSAHETLRRQFTAMTADRDRLQARVRDLEIEIDAAGQQPAPADRSEQIERIWDEARERAVSEIIELLIPLQVATGTHAESVLQILPAVIRRWMDGGPDDVE